MKIQTFSIVVGTKACNATCPFCVSRMTGFEPVIGTRGSINDLHFEKACRLAQIGGTTTVLLTGKGEPTLYPEEITSYLSALDKWNFPLIELQTNAFGFAKLAHDKSPRIPGLHDSTVSDWRDKGLNTIAISAVSDIWEENAEIYGRNYGMLGVTADYLHRMGFSVRLCIMMVKGFIDNPDRIDRLIDFCRKHGIEQLTVRPIRQPMVAQDTDASTFVLERGITKAQEIEIQRHIEGRGTRLLSLMHGAQVFDIDGQNICLSDCLTNEPTNGDIRTLIFYSDGRLCYDWQYDGAIILGGNSGPPKPELP